MPDAWSSRLLGRVGAAAVKVVRMDGRALAPESHGTAEALLVLDGTLRLAVGDAELEVGPGRMCLGEAGVRHAVRPGSHGTLVVVERTPDAADGQVVSNARSGAGSPPSGWVARAAGR
ncbi:conserved protein of unknown function (plasmid) [Streptantibioticus cattleyicolor NRRL 8057 = DSM 46488]|nr:conserved protein of unknown function [Streptantibioticus cattleyicolor NRRL 8057 = DSM 46488]